MTKKTPDTSYRVDCDKQVLFRSPSEAIRLQLALAVNSPETGGTIWLDQPFNLYLSDKQADAYLAAMATPQYVTAFHDPLAQLIEDHADVLTRRFDGAIAFVDLGPGKPDKSLPLLRALRKSGVDCCYVPVDVSARFLNIAVSAVEAEGFASCPQRCLFEEVSGVLDTKPRIRDCSRLINMGLTFMNYRPAAATSLLQSLLRSKDAAIVATELFRSEARAELPYRNSAAERFTFLPLEAAGIPRDAADYFVRYRAERVEMGFNIRSDIRLADNVLIRSGTEIVTSLSHRYTIDKFRDLLEMQFDVDIAIDRDRLVGLALISASRSGERVL